MKKAANIFVLILLSISVRAQSRPDIDLLISQMSIEEKVGQMCQVDLGVVAKGSICNLQIPQEIDTAKLITAIHRYHIGSILNVGCGAGAINIRNWRQILQTIESTNKRYSKNQIPILYGIDAIHGAGYTEGSILLPQQLAQAATWNPNLIQSGYEMTAYETRASGLPWTFSPVLDMGRQPLWSRFCETYGEDVYLAKTMTTAAIKGLQGNNLNSPYHIASCMKHFLGYSLPFSGKDRTPTWIGPRALMEYFLPTFQTAIELDAATLMVNSGEIDGIPVHDNYELLTTLLRDKLGFTGVVVTDWEDIWKLVDVHHVAKNKKEAVKKAILAGIDMSMAPNDLEFCDLLLELIREGSITEHRIDMSVKRILELKKKLGLFDHFTYPSSYYPDFASSKHKLISRQSAEESITLLKNERSILPIAKNKKIFICGPGAKNSDVLCGPWSRTWQGVNENPSIPVTTILDAFRNKMSSIQYHPGTTYDSILNIDICKQAAANSDYVVICLAEKPSVELPGNINSLELPEAQKKLVKEIASIGKNIILICNFNRPLIIHDEVAMAGSVLYAYYPGQEGGGAIADIIMGNTNPSGKLPFTYPAASGSIVHYDRKYSENMDVDFSSHAYRPEFDFGFGLSYTKFTYTDLKINKDTFANQDNIRISLNISNTGLRAGKEVVQIYYSDLIASITPSVKKLCAYQKINLSPGETQKITFDIPTSRLSFIDNNLKRIIESGEFEFSVQNLKQKIYVR